MSNQRNKKSEKIFNEVLDKFMVGTEVPEMYGPESGHLTTVPNEAELVPVKDSCETQIEGKPANGQPSTAEITSNLYDCMIRSIGKRSSEPPSPVPERNDDDFLDDEQEGEIHDYEELQHVDAPTNINRKDLDIIKNGFPNESDFSVASAFPPDKIVEARRTYAAKYREVSKELDLPDFRICCVEKCLNNAVPGFHFCFNHFGLDPKFNEQFLFDRCEAVINGYQCTNPCIKGTKYCNFHMEQH